MCFVMHYYLYKRFIRKYNNFFLFFPLFLSSAWLIIRPISSDQLGGQKPTIRSFVSRTLRTVQERNAVVDFTEWSRLSRCRRYMYRFRQEFIYSRAETRRDNHGISIASLICLSRYQVLTAIKLFLNFLRILRDFLNRIISISELIGDFNDCRFGGAIFVISMKPAWLHAVIVFVIFWKHYHKRDFLICPLLKSSETNFE